MNVDEQKMPQHRAHPRMRFIGQEREHGFEQFRHGLVRRENMLRVTDENRAVPKAR